MYTRENNSLNFLEVKFMGNTKYSVKSLSTWHPLTVIVSAWIKIIAKAK